MRGSQHVRERNDECLCTVPLFCLSLLSLQLVVCLCSVVHRTVYTLTRSCLSARTIHDLVARLKILRLRCSHEKFITMSSMFALAHERSTLTSSSSIPSSRTTSQVTLPINKHCVTPPRRGVWLFGQSYFFHRLWAQRDRQLRLLRDYWNLPPGAIQRHNADTIGKALSSPLFIQEREEPAGRRQAYHSSEESLLSSQSLSVGHVRTERPVHELSSLGSSSSREMENETREELPPKKKVTW